MYIPPGDPQIIFSLKREDFEGFAKLQDKDLTGYRLKFWKPREKSVNANSYLWVICDKIAKAIGATKEDVYRKAVRESGTWIDGYWKKEDYKELDRSWSGNGIGWFTEAIQAYTNGLICVRCYKGSSVYSGEEMSRLIDYVVSEAKELGIETMTPDQIAEMKSLWG